MSKRKLHRNPSEPNELKAMALAGESSILVCDENTALYNRSLVASDGRLDVGGG